jgi:hypothetical protein
MLLVLNAVVVSNVVVVEVDLFVMLLVSKTVVVFQVVVVDLLVILLVSKPVV